MSSFIQYWFDFAHVSVTGGLTFSLASICLFQYLLHAYRLSISREQSDKYRREMEGLEDELTSVQKDRTLTRLENHILREFVTETECDKALGLVLRRFVADAKGGFSAYVQLASGTPSVEQSRGLSEESIRGIRLDAGLIDHLRGGKGIVLEGNALLGSPLYGSLSTSDRQKARQVFLFGVGDGEELLGVMLTTGLVPLGAPRGQQLELAERLMLCLGNSLKKKQAAQLQEQQLRWTSDMLELRAITDRHFDTPLQMIQEFVSQVTEKLTADRGALFLSSIGGSSPITGITQCGSTLQVGIREQWQKFEEMLADTGLGFDELVAYDADALERAGIDKLIGAALVVPLVQEHGAIGVMCFTKRERTQFLDEHQQLAKWAGSFLAEKILRAISQAAIERQARLDGLTQLANRRTFDQQIRRELQCAHTTNSECSLLLLDLDRFKLVNDTYGHQAGDHVLRIVSHMIRDRVVQIRSGDHALCARYGGEELAVVLPGVGLQGAARIGEAIRARLESTPIEFDRITLHVTVSVGIAAYPFSGTTAEQLISVADAALYQAKANGRNQVALPVSEPVVALLPVPTPA